MTEAHVARVTAAYMSATGWEVFPEVAVYTGDTSTAHVAIRNDKKVADLVARKCGRIWIVEAKTSLTPQLMSQIRRWRRHADKLSIAVPAVKRMNQKRAKREGALVIEGVGVMGIRDTAVVYYRPARYMQRVVDYAIDALDERQKTFADAGNAEHTRWSPFQETRRRVAEYVLDHPGVTAGQVVRAVTTHYCRISVARVAVGQWARAGEIPGVFAVKKNGQITLYPKDA